MKFNVGDAIYHDAWNPAIRAGIINKIEDNGYYKKLWCRFTSFDYIPEIHELKEGSHNAFIRTNSDCNIHILKPLNKNRRVIDK